MARDERGQSRQCDKDWCGGNHDFATTVGQSGKRQTEVGLKNVGGLLRRRRGKRS